MEYITPYNRSQIEFSSLDDLVEQDNQVRFIEAFVEKLDLIQLSFVTKDIKSEGRPSFNPKALLKLYFYGYLNGILSSRRLEKECKRNIELQWLMQKLIPNYHTIADFRKVNPGALKNTFKLFVLFLKDMGLVAGHTVAIDGTKVRAHNSKKNNYSPKKIERHLQYIEEKTNDYLNQLDTNDTQEDIIKINNIKEKIAHLLID
jgi:transposase